MNANQEQLYKDVAFLTELKPARNYLNLGSLEKVCSYLKQEIRKAGGEPREQQWEAQGET